jgi:hypothetical protein
LLVDKAFFEDARRMGKGACAAVVCLSVFAAPTTLAASLTPSADSGPSSLMVTLDYAAAAGCPDAAQYKAVVRSRLGYDPFGDGVPDRVSVRISVHGRDYEGRIEWRDAQGNWVGDRTFPSHSDDCGELARAMGFALALQIQLSATPAAQAKAKPDMTESPAQAVEASRPPDAHPDDTDDTPQSKEMVVSTLVTTPSNRAARPDFAVGVGSLMGFGVSSRPVPFGRLFGSVAWTHLLLELGGEVSWPSTVRRADGGGFSQEELLLSVAGCGVFLPWNACLVTKAGGIQIAGEGVDRPASSTGAIWEAGLRLALVQPLGRHVYLAAHAEALVMLTKWSVRLDRYLVFTSQRFLETAGLDIGVRLP